MTFELLNHECFPQEWIEIDSFECRIYIDVYHSIHDSIFIDV